MSTQHAFANNFWGKDDAGYQRLVQRMHHAKLTCEELQAFYKERMSIEAEYAKKLSNLARKALGSKETGSLRRSLDVLRSATDQMATSHHTVSRQIQEEFLAPLDSFSSNMRDRRKTSEDIMARLSKAKKSQNELVERARSKYEQECHKVTGYKAQQNLLMGKELERNNAKLERCNFNVEQLQRDYQASLNVLSQTTENWNATWKLTCDKFQELEDERIRYIKSNLWDFTNATSTACVNDDEGFEAIRVGLEQCEATNDLVEFVQESGTGGQIMDPPEFTNYLSGFTRDSNGEGYKLAKFGNEKEHNEADDSINRSFDRSYQAEDDSYTQNQIMSMSHSSHLSLDNTPNLGPELRTTVLEDDEYSSGSPYQGSMSPSSSVYSPATTIESPQMAKFSPQEFEPTPVEQKRRSWAKPFKRQSSPDLSKVWNALSSSQSSASSGRFQTQDSDAFDKALGQSVENHLHNQTQNNAHIRFDDTVNDSSDRYRRTRQTQMDQGAGSHARVKVASKVAHEEDPMLAAIDKLKTPPLGTNTQQATQRKLARPASMPGIAALGPQTSPQRKPVHADARQAPPMKPPANKSTTVTAAAAPYPEDFATPQVIPARAPERDRRYSFNPQSYQEPHTQKRLDHRRSAEAYGQSPYHSPQHSPQRSPQQQQQDQHARSKVQARPRPKSSADAASERNLLPSRTSDGRQVIMHARALFDFRSRIPMEVSFRKNDILLVTHTQEDGWWEAEVLTTKATGVAPGNFLQQLR